MYLVVFHITGKTLLHRQHEIVPSLTMPIANPLFLKWVAYLIFCHLLHLSIFFQLVRNILLNSLFILSYRVHVVTTAPKFSIPIFIFHICILLVYQYTAFAFQIPHKPTHAQLWWYAYQHMHMVWAYFSLNNFYFFPFAQQT